MNRCVIDASVAIKWVIDETGSEESLALRGSGVMVAPDLLNAECANILWKKVQRDELTSEEAGMAARLLQRADVEIHPTRQLLEQAMHLAIALGHPAYDCIYLSLAIENDWPFITADQRLLRRLAETEDPVLHAIARPLFGTDA